MLGADVHSSPEPGLRSDGQTVRRSDVGQARSILPPELRRLLLREANEDPSQFVFHSKANRCSGCLGTLGWKVLDLPAQVPSLMTSLCFPGSRASRCQLAREGGECNLPPSARPTGQDVTERACGGGPLGQREIAKKGLKKATKELLQK